MTIGILSIYCSGELLERESIEHFEHSMRPSFDSVSDKVDFDYRRFAYFATSLQFIVHLREMWNNQTIFNNLRKYLTKYFINWELTLVLTIHQKGD